MFRFEEISLDLKRHILTKEKLIEFGHKLNAKGRTPTQIVNALEHKSSNSVLINEVLEVIFKDETPKIKRSPERVKTFLKANRLKLNHEYAIRSSFVGSFFTIYLFFSQTSFRSNAYYYLPKL